MNTGIEHARQNHPKLIIRDLAGEDTSFANKVKHVLKHRGVNKWLRNRRLLIQLKDRMKKEIRDLQEYADIYNDLYKLTGHKSHKVLALKASTRMNTLADVRQQLRAIFHSPRDVDFPDHDWGDICNLPEDFPQRPRKNYFRTLNVGERTCD